MSQIPTVSNMLYHRFTGFLSTALLSSSTLVLCILHIHLLVIISDMVIFILKVSFCITDFNFGSIIRQIRCYHGLHSPFESSLIEF